MSKFRHVLNYLTHAGVVADVCGVQAHTLSLVDLLNVLPFLSLCHLLARPTRSFLLHFEERLYVLPKHRLVPSTPVVNLVYAYHSIAEVVDGFEEFHGGEDAVDAAFFVVVGAGGIDLLLCADAAQRKEEFSPCFVGEQREQQALWRENSALDKPSEPSMDGGEIPKILCQNRRVADHEIPRLLHERVQRLYVVVPYHRVLVCACVELEGVGSATAQRESRVQWFRGFIAGNCLRQLRVSLKHLLPLAFPHFGDTETMAAEGGHSLVRSVAEVPHLVTVQTVHSVTPVVCGAAVKEVPLKFRKECFITCIR